VLLDLVMPQLAGDRTCVELQRLEPGVRVILCSGYHGQEALDRFRGRGLAEFVQKASHVATLRAQRRTVLEGRRQATRTDA